ncbi:MAG: GNAT family N-acetyltransferase, partial [Chloroflexi bacterium]
MSVLLPNIEFHPVTPERWHDLETLFGKSGAYGGCWCMWWRASRSEFEKQGNAGNRQALKNSVDAGEVPGLLAY